MHFLRLIAFIALLACTVCAQDVVPLAEVNRIFTTPGAAERFVKFSGTVIQSVPRLNLFYVQDGAQGIEVVLEKELPVPALGERVEVETKVKFVVNNGDTTVRASAVRVTGRPGLPEPIKAKVPLIRSGKTNRQSVEVEAVVLGAFSNPEGVVGGWWLMLSDDEGACLGGIYSFPEGWRPDALIGKQVRFRGIGMPGGEYLLRCSTPDDVTVIGEAAGTKALTPFTSAKGIRDYGVVNARARPYPALFRGVCTFAETDRSRFFIQEATGGLEVRCRASQCPKRGDEVFVKGITLAGTGAIAITGWDVDVLASGEEPPPFKWNLEPVLHTERWGDWFEAEGVVIQVQKNRRLGAMAFYIVENDSWTRVWVTTPPPEPPGGWWNARIRVRGVLVHDGRLLLFSNGGKDFTVVSPGIAAPFNVPAVTAASLRSAPRSAARVRAKGTVLSFNDDWLYVRDATGAFRTDTAMHFEPEAVNDVLPNYVRWPEGGPKAGDEVELAGSPMAPNGGMRFSLVRVLKSGPVPPAKSVKLADAAGGAAASDLVTLRGRLANYTSGFISDMYTMKRWREALRLEDGKDALEVIFENAGNEGAFAKFVAGDLIEATGIVRYEGGVPTFRLRIRTMDDIRSLGPDPSIARDRLVKVITVAIAAILAALAWAGLTQRKVARRTAQLAAANAKLDAALAQERELGDLKTRFVSLVSHEFRTPLGITMSAVELLRHYADRLPKEKLAELHGDIHSATLRMSAMMEQVLVLGRFEAGKVAFTARPLGLADLGAKLADESLSATDRKCPIQFRADGDLSGAAGDEGLMRHIFSNLLSNAAKYSPAEKPVEFSVTRAGNDAVFTVRDRGIGIPAADQARLFEAFHRAANVGETPGTGLGMLIVKRCVEMHRGIITFESYEGEGTTFTVRLPLFAT